jgi:hypothetical protein
MYVELDQGRVTDAAEAMDLAGLDDKNVDGDRDRARRGR